MVCWESFFDGPTRHLWPQWSAFQSLQEPTHRHGRRNPILLNYVVTIRHDIHTRFKLDLELDSEM